MKKYNVLLSNTLNLVCVSYYSNTKVLINGKWIELCNKISGWIIFSKTFWFWVYLIACFTFFVSIYSPFLPQLNNSVQMIIPFMFTPHFFSPILKQINNEKFKIKCVGYVWKNDDKRSQHMENVRNTYFPGQLLVDNLQAKYLIKDVHNIFSLVIYFWVEDKLMFLLLKFQIFSKTLNHFHVFHLCFRNTNQIIIIRVCRKWYLS